MQVQPRSHRGGDGSNSATRWVGAGAGVERNGVPSAIAGQIGAMEDPHLGN